MSNERILGENMKKLLARVVARKSIPPGGGFVDGVNFLKSGKIGTVSRESLKWIDEQIHAIRSTPDNTYGDDEETIAEAILAMLAERK